MSSSFESAIRDAKCDRIHKVFTTEGEKYMCFTGFSKTWKVCVTDGVTLWKQDLDEEEAETVAELAGIKSTEAFLNRFRNGVQSGDLQVNVLGNKVHLKVGKGSATVDFDLFEAKAAEKKVEMQEVLFWLAEQSTKLSHDLELANQTIDSLKATKGAGPTSAFMDLGPKKGQNPNKNKPKKVGMSVLNPSSKKRKAAHGVVFD